MVRVPPSRSSSPASRFTLALMLAAAVFAASLPAYAARDGFLYEVTITNASYNQRFTPFLVATHEPSVRLFTIGAAASNELATLAEDGNVAPLRAVLDADARVNATEAGSGLTVPGATTTLRVRGRPHHDRLSLAAMLIPTNDAFVALSGVALPFHGSAEYTARAYDSGSEINDELCASIPGPGFMECGGNGGGGKPGGGEGFVHVHRGIHGIGDFLPASRAWSNPVAFIRITRVQ